MSLTVNITVKMGGLVYSVQYTVHVRPSLTFGFCKQDSDNANILGLLIKIPLQIL